MVQSLELILDDTLDKAVRREWHMLLDADLPSQGRHTGESNRPHITLAVADDLDEMDARIDEEMLAVRFPVRLGAFVVFRAKHLTLARLVVPSKELVSLHGRTSLLAGAGDDVRAHTTPGRWTPHVTLARRLTRVELAEAFLRLHGCPSDLVGSTAALRRWDGEEKREWQVR
ncbi:MAG: 2'-5' RNA ligase family protein [Rhodococcus sp. (in: high G+C Gram-positive bacteria)]